MITGWSAKRARALTVREGVRVVDVRRQSGGFVARTAGGAEIHCRVLLGTGGATGMVRKAISDPKQPPRISRLLEVLTPEPEGIVSDEFARGYAVLDFTPILRGVQGYYWDFPSYVAGRPTMNRGVFDSRVRRDLPLANLKQVFAASLADRGHDLATLPLHGHPSRWYDNHAPVHAERVLLAGDEAGFDPLLAKGSHSR